MHEFGSPFHSIELSAWPNYQKVNESEWDEETAAALIQVDEEESKMNYSNRQHYLCICMCWCDIEWTKFPHWVDSVDVERGHMQLLLSNWSYHIASLGVGDSWSLEDKRKKAKGGKEKREKTRENTGGSFTERTLRTDSELVTWKISQYTPFE